MVSNIYINFGNFKSVYKLPILLDAFNFNPTLKFFFLTGNPTLKLVPQKKLPTFQGNLALDSDKEWTLWIVLG